MNLDLNALSLATTVWGMSSLLTQVTVVPTPWLTAFCRVVWRLAFAYGPALPAATPAIQKRLARANEVALYALLLIQPLTGLAQSLTRGRPVPLLVVRFDQYEGM